MKANIKSILAFGAALMIGLTGCNKDDQTATAETQSVSVKINVSKSTNPTKADEASSVGVSPAVNDVRIFFIGNGSVLAVELFTADLSTGTASQTFNDISAGATKVYVLGNADALASPTPLPVVGASEASLNATMLDILAQTDAQTAVNITGQGPITRANNVGTADVSVRPAIARIEIAQVSADPAAVVPLTSFRLTGIYITNTYFMLGLDYSTLPTDPAFIVNYDGTTWPATGYPTQFSDEFPAALPATTFNPVNGTWAYFVMPPVAGRGTLMNGLLQTSVPIIVLRIEDAETSNPDVEIPSPAYVNIVNLTQGGIALDRFQEGRVYSIADILFGGEHLSVTPTIPTIVDVNVNVTVLPWEDQPVVPDL